MLKLTIILLTYNRPESFLNTLSSLVEQNWPSDEFEIIICDDGTATNISDMIKSFSERCNIRITYFRQEHSGVSAARNLGIKHAQGDYISFIADDYLIPRDYISRVFSFFRSHPDASVVTFNIKNYGKEIWNRAENLYFQLTLLQDVDGKINSGDVLEGKNISASRAAVFKKDVFSNIGLFDESLPGGEDTDFTLRLNRVGVKLYFIPDYFIEHRHKTDFLSLLNRRRRYAYYFYCFSKKYPCSVDNFDFSLLGIILQVIRKSARFFNISKKLKMQREFIFYFPLILFFLLLRYCEIYRLYLKDRNR